MWRPRSSSQQSLHGFYPFIFVFNYTRADAGARSILHRLRSLYDFTESCFGVCLRPAEKNAPNWNERYNYWCNGSGLAISISMDRQLGLVYLKIGAKLELLEHEEVVKV